MKRDNPGWTQAEVLGDCHVEPRCVALLAMTTTNATFLGLRVKEDRAMPNAFYDLIDRDS